MIEKKIKERGLDRKEEDQQKQESETESHYENVRQGSVEKDEDE